jgi:hypothetical protein
MFTLAGGPVINLDNDTVVVETTSDLELNGTIGGFPSPNVVISREEGVDMFVPIDPANRRFTFFFNSTTARLSIRIRDILRKDMGKYRISATNEHDSVEAFFTVCPKGQSIRV